MTLGTSHFLPQNVIVHLKVFIFYMYEYFVYMYRCNVHHVCTVTMEVRRQH